MRHTCHARGCEVPVPRKMFMCRRHWYMVPKHLRDAVWTNYTPGQERDLSRVTDEYLNVTRLAREAVQERESA